MNHRRLASLVLLTVVLVGGGFLLHGCLGANGDRARIRVRYEAMQTAMRAGDTNAARMLFAPEYRARWQDHLGRYPTFALPLDHRSGISIEESSARVCPRRLFPLIPLGTVGHTIEMIEVDGEWYFTGKIGIW